MKNIDHFAEKSCKYRRAVLEDGLFLRFHTPKTLELYNSAYYFGHNVRNLQ